MKLLTLNICFIALAFLEGCGLCGSRVTKVYPSPNKSKAIVLIASDCGATTNPTLAVYVVSEKKLKTINNESPKINKKYEIYARERGTVITKWISDNHIEVLYDFTPQYGRTGEFFRQRDKVSGVKITYTEADKATIKNR